MEKWENKKDFKSHIFVWLGVEKWNNRKSKFV